MAAFRCKKPGYRSPVFLSARKNKMKCHNKEHDCCITLIGMPGAGKSTIGRQLAKKLDCAFVDTDYLIESLYARRLQEITNILGVEEFRNVECRVICSLRAQRCVIATGGSVVYREEAMQHLQRMGKIVHLHLPLAEVIKRVEQFPDRGISFGPGQSLAHLYEERQELYNKYGNLICDTSLADARECTEFICRHLD